MNQWLYPSESLWQAPLGWLGISIGIGTCLWFLYPQATPAYRGLLRNTRWIVIPYLGLLMGGISPRLMGLSGINWFASFGFGLVLIGGVLVLLIIIRSVTSFSFSALPSSPARNEIVPQRDLAVRYPANFLSSFLDIGAEEFHWAFLRSATWEILLAFPLLATQAGYWAAWVAVLLALPEVLRYQVTSAQRLCKCALLITTTVLFLFTRNLWLSWLLHTLGWALLLPSLPNEPFPNQPLKSHTYR